MQFVKSISPLVVQASVGIAASGLPCIIRCPLSQIRVSSGEVNLNTPIATITMMIIQKIRGNDFFIVFCYLVIKLI